MLCPIADSTTTGSLTREQPGGLQLIFMEEPIFATHRAQKSAARKKKEIKLEPTNPPQAAELARTTD